MSGDTARSRNGSERRKGLIELPAPWGFDAFVPAGSEPADLRNLAEAYLTTLQAVFDEEDPHRTRTFSPEVLYSIWQQIASARALLKAADECEAARAAKVSPRAARGPAHE